MDTAQLASLVDNSRMVRVTSDVLDIGHRIQHGDEMWRGDPTMSLNWSPVSGEFEVWGLDAHGDPYMAASHPRCDHELILKLVAGDWQRCDVFSRLEQENAARRKADEDKTAEKLGEAVDKLAWAVQRDAGYLYGGLSRNVWAVGGLDG